MCYFGLISSDCVYAWYFVCVLVGCVDLILRLLGCWLITHTWIVSSFCCFCGVVLQFVSCVGFCVWCSIVGLGSLVGLLMLLVVCRCCACG